MSQTLLPAPEPLTNFYCAELRCVLVFVLQPGGGDDDDHDDGDL